MKRFLISLSFWKKVLPKIEIWVDNFCLWISEKYVTYSSGIHSFWWEINFQSNYFSPVSKVLFYCLQYVFSCFLKLYVCLVSVWEWISLSFPFWDLFSLKLGCCFFFFFFCQSWKCFSHYFLKYTFSPSICLLCLWNSVDISNTY